MSDTYQLQFDRVAERLAFKTLQKKISDDIGIDIGSIYLQSPPPQYVNTRTETENKLEEARYPSLAIYSVKEDELSALGNTLEIIRVNEGGVGGALEKFFESKVLVRQTLEFSLETTTKKDFMDYKQRLNLWFADNRTLQFLNDTLPNIGSMAIVVLNKKDYTIDSPYESLFNVEITYRLHKEFLAYAMLEFEIYGSVQVNENVKTTEDNVSEQWWTNLDPYTDLP